MPEDKTDKQPVTGSRNQAESTPETGGLSPRRQSATTCRREETKSGPVWYCVNFDVRVSEYAISGASAHFHQQSIISREARLAPREHERLTGGRPVAFLPWGGYLGGVCAPAMRTEVRGR
jgi:hypothetical protein